MAINVTQIATSEATIVIVVINNVPYKRTFTSENEVNSFLAMVATKDENNPDDVQEVLNVLQGIVNEDVSEDIESDKRALAIVENYKHLSMYGIIEENGAFYMAGGPKISMPKRLVDEFAHRISMNEPTEPLMNFWKLCLLNPDSQARDDLFKFLADSKMEITPAGLFVSYRNIKEKSRPVKSQIQEVASSTVEKNADALQSFVNETYAKQRKAKKSTNLSVWLVDILDEAGNSIGQKFETTKNPDIKPENALQLMGNLKEMHAKFEAPEKITKELAPPKVDTTEDRFKKIYTDDYTGKMEIRMLHEVRLPREKCDSNNAIQCSNGLHVGTESFVKRNAFGTVGVKVLINPRNVVSVPYNANTKMRVSAYFPFDFIEYNEDGSVKVSKENTFDYAYVDYDMGQMQKQILELTIEELEHKVILPKGMTIGHFGKLVGEIADDIVRNRVIKIN